MNETVNANSLKREHMPSNNIQFQRNSSSGKIKDGQSPFKFYKNSKIKERPTNNDLSNPVLNSSILSRSDAFTSYTP